MQELTLLHTKLEQLLKKHAALQAENKALHNTVREQDEQFQKLNKKVTLLDEELANNKTAEALTGKEDKSAVKKQLNSLIGDIDKLLASLND